MALALNLDPALMKKSDPRDPTALLFPERELTIRIGSTGLLSGKLSAAAAAELGQRVRPRAVGRREGNARLSALADRSPHCSRWPLPMSFSLICSCGLSPIAQLGERTGTTLNWMRLI